MPMHDKKESAGFADGVATNATAAVADGADVAGSSAVAVSQSGLYPADTPINDDASDHWSVVDGESKGADTVGVV